MGLASAVRTIILKTYDNNRIELQHDDGTVAIYPGEAIVEKALGTCEHTTQEPTSPDKETVPMIVTENNLFGEEITDSYVKGDQVSVWIPQRGDVGYVRIKTASAVAITFGQALVPDATGRFVGATAEAKASSNVQTQGDKPVCMSLEAIANTVAVKDADIMCKVRFI